MLGSRACDRRHCSGANVIAPKPRAPLNAGPGARQPGNNTYSEKQGERGSNQQHGLGIHSCSIYGYLGMVLHAILVNDSNQGKIKSVLKQYIKWSVVMLGEDPSI
jgi:hypothetical protein